MKKILVVEDEKDIVEFIKFRLEANRYKVEVAYDGEEGLKMAVSCKPDLILLDIMLPKKSGLEALRELKRPDSSLRNTPIVILSGLRDTTNLLEAEKFGATDYLTKPYDPEELLRVIRENIL